MCPSGAVSISLIPDLIVITLLYNMKPRRKEIENMLKKISRIGIFGEDFIRPTYQKHKVVFDQYIESALDLAEVLVGSPEQSVGEGSGGALVRAIFCKSDILVGKQLVHRLLSSAAQAETGWALVTLETLSRYLGIKLGSL